MVSKGLAGKDLRSLVQEASRGQAYGACVLVDGGVLRASDLRGVFVWMSGELFPRVAFIVSNLELPAVVPFYNKWGFISSGGMKCREIV